MHNSGASDDTDMKLGPVTKLDKRNKIMPEKFDDNVMSENFGVITIFPIDGQFRAIQKPVSGTWSVKRIFSLIAIFYIIKTENKTKKSLTQLSHYCFEQRYYFGQKMLIFLQKILTSAKLRGPWY